MIAKGKAVCNKCKKDAFFYNGKWWCATVSNPGHWNLTGACKTKRYREGQ